MTKLRAVQTSMFPDLAPDKPTGKILPSVFVGTNADLMAAVAPYYLTGSVCDVTYGLGRWWQQFRPVEFVAHDLDPTKGDGVDFTALPEPDDTYDAVTFDPPYMPDTGGTFSTVPDFLYRFGIGRETSLESLPAALVEIARVVRPSGYVLTKCMDFVKGGKFILGHVEMLDAARAAGLQCHDIIIHHTGTGPGGHNIFDPKRARRHHSYLIVFAKGRP